MKKTLLLLFLFITTFSVFAQEINENEELKHYMPLYLDMPAELNVKKGYKEINIAGGYANFKDFNGIRSLLEYDFAPIDKLGFEIEMPFIFVNSKVPVQPQTGVEDVIVPEEGGNAKSAMALRIGFNYTFLSLKKAKTTFAVGYFNEFESSPFVNFGKPVIEANVYNPFIAVAKIWGNRLHSMIYTGPAIQQVFEHHTTKTEYRFNTILTYRFGKNDNESFAGIECNQAFEKGNNAQMVLRPQVQLHISKQWKIGIVGGIPIATVNHLNGSGFLRLIYSPKSSK